MKNVKSKMINVKSRRAGFSLVELLVVITIIAILSVVAYTAIGGQTIKARDSKRMQDLSTMQSAMELYFVEFATYPNAPLTSGAVVGQVPRKYLSTIPTDPKDATQVYEYWSDGSSYVIGTTLEDDGTGAEVAYIVGNSDSGPNLTVAGGYPADCAMLVDSACKPYTHVVTP